MEKEILQNLRQDYKSNTLNELDSPENPLDMFEKWFKEALNSGIYEPNAMTLATVNDEGKPSARIVLLKGFDKNRFTFYTNYTSRKGKEIDQNPFVSLLFFWPELERQIRIGGQIQKTPTAESIAYFQSRPRGSQIGALSSPQSQIIPNREFLDNRWKELEDFWGDKPIQKPEYWGGYDVFPQELEFWQGRSSRLHDRLSYRMKGSTWIRNRLAP
jgi:pyridoxamine 5'-phosphate oxidase